MSGLLGILSDFILPVIIISAVVCALCAVEAILGIDREGRELEKLKVLLREKGSFTDEKSSYTARMTSLEEWLKEKGDEARIGQGRLLQLRLETIRDSIRTDKSRVMPSLRDLHSLSLQDEMSRTSTCWMRTVISVLLIMGILGTLSGVHGVVGGHHSGNINVADLGSALKPSMCAVFFTVILTWIKGWYVALLDGYLEKLDLFTMTEIVPALQPVSDVHIKTVELSGGLKKMSENADKLEAVIRDMEALQKRIDSSVAQADRFAGELDGMKEDLSTAKKQLVNVQASIAGRNKELSDLIRAAESTDERFKVAVNDVKRYLEEVETRCREVKPQYETLIHNLQTAAEDVQVGRITMREMAGKAEEMAAMGRLVNEYETTLSELSGDAMLIRNTMAEMERLKEEIATSENVVCDSSVQAEAMLESTADIMRELNEKNTDFSMNVASGTSDVAAAMAQLEEELRAFRAAADGVSREWKKRAEQIGL